MKRTVLLVLAVLAAVNAHAESWTTTKKVCGAAFSSRPGPNPNESHVPAQPEPAWRLHTLEECGIDLFTLAPVGPTMGSIGTGSGFGAGAHVKYAFDANHILTLKALFSINSSNFLNAKYRIVFKPYPTD